VGRALACHALTEAARAGRHKVVVEVAADQEHALAMFRSLGFTGEAVLRDHIRDGNGKLHDLVMLAHYVDGTSGRMKTADLTKELSSEVSAR
jgi:ribosomal protein S18 acetylase RimI-like enzyme